MSFSNVRTEWFGNIRGDLLSGSVVALALIPEAIAFSIIAGVDPKVGLYASFCIAIVISITGGRPGMISAATGAMALVLVSLVKDHGLQYMFAATLLAGAIQIVAGLLGVGSWIRFVSKSVVTGFVNALAILIFAAQMPELAGGDWRVFAMVGAGLGIIYLFPYVTKAVPSPLVAIIFLTLFDWLIGLDIRTVNDMGKLPDAFPPFLLPDVPLTLETLMIIFPYSVTLAAVGLLESLMTAVIVDEMTDTSSAKNRECVGQGTANIVAGMFGGMAGCAMIGQSVINVKSGGRGRLSTFFAGVFLLFLILVLSDFVSQIPMAALVAVMIMVSISTFQWSSIKNITIYPKTSSLVMVTTVAVVVWTHNLALGVFIGVLMSALFFAKRVSTQIEVHLSEKEDDRQRTYEVEGQLFFASAGQFLEIFRFDEGLDKVVIDLSRAHIWDLTGVSALDKVILKFRAAGAEVELKGLNHASAMIVDKLGIHNQPGALETLLHTGK